MKLKPNKKMRLSALVIATSVLAGGGLITKSFKNARSDIFSIQIEKQSEEQLVASCDITCLNTCGFTNKC